MRRDFSRTFQRQLASQRLQLERRQQKWIERFEPPARSTAAILNFGCDAQLTPHLMIETVGVLNALDVDFVAVAGPQWCCGQPYVEWGEDAAGRNMTKGSVARMAAYAPRETVHWCGAWWPRMDAAFPDGGPLVLTHITTFLARVLHEREGRIPWRAEVRQAVLLHLRSHHPGMAAERAAVMAAMEAAVPAALALVPGLRLAGNAPVPSRGLPCELDRERRSVLADLSEAERATFQKEVVASAHVAGADLLVTAHQTCHREWGKLTSDDLPVRHYVSILADALGCGVPDRYHRYWRMRDTEAIVSDARDAWVSWGIDEDRAGEIAAALFMHDAD